MIRKLQEYHELLYIPIAQKDLKEIWIIIYKSNT